MTSRTERFVALGALLASCERHSHEPNLQPVHRVADLPLDSDLKTCLRNYLASCGYHGSGDLVLTPIDDWSTEVARLPLFDAGFPPLGDDTDEDASCRRQIAAAIHDLVGSNAQVWRVGASDSTGAMLTPTGGLHTYLVFESGAGRLFVDLDWDS